MDLSKLPPAMISQMASMVEDYIASSRKKYASQAAPLTDAQRGAMQPYFPAEVLDNARLCVLRGSRVPNPSMYSMAKMMGIRNLPDFSEMTAITFVDVVVSHEEFTDALLFHELVHAVQYAQMGLKEFSSRYVNGFIQGGSYEEVPLEKHAYLLEGRFREGQPFSVDSKKCGSGGKRGRFSALFRALPTVTRSRVISPTLGIFPNTNALAYQILGAARMIPRFLETRKRLVLSEPLFACTMLETP